jgi:hypothetical protein
MLNELHKLSSSLSADIHAAKRNVTPHEWSQQELSEWLVREKFSKSVIAALAQCDGATFGKNSSQQQHTRAWLCFDV